MALKEPHSRTPRWIATACGLLATVLLAEGIARIEGPTVCVDDDQALLQADPEVGWTFIPGLDVTLEDCAGNAWSAPLSINREGLADQHWPHEKRPGDVRVVLLGNHVSDGLGVAREDRLSVRIAHLADAVRGSRVSVVNATIPGYATAEQLRWLEKRGLRYSPDVVVLVLDPGRDLAANLRPTAPRIPPADLAPASGLLALSGVARWISGKPAVDSGPRLEVVEPPSLENPAERQHALQKTRELVGELAETARKAGAGFAVLVAPPCPAPPQPTAICEALQDVAPCLDPTPTFEGLRRSTTRTLELCNESLGRWGRDGHFLASHALWDLLVRSKVWPPGVVRGHRL